MKRIRKQYFNMVEIILAVVVLAVGMTGVFVLFPVGLKSHGNAKGENTVADLAEYLMAFVRAEVSLNAIDEKAVKTRADGESYQKAYCFNLNQSKFTAAKLFSTANDDSGDKSKRTEIEDSVDVDAVDDWEMLTSNSGVTSGGGSKESLTADKKTVYLLKHKTKPGFFLVRQTAGPNGDIVDFSAVAKIWSDTKTGNSSGYENDFFPSVMKGNSHGYRSTYAIIRSRSSYIKINDFLLPVMLEISWPATLPYDQREKRFFRFEIFNEEYEQKKAE